LELLLSRVPMSAIGTKRAHRERPVTPANAKVVETLTLDAMHRHAAWECPARSVERR